MGCGERDETNGSGRFGRGGGEYDAECDEAEADAVHAYAEGRGSVGVQAQRTEHTTGPHRRAGIAARSSTAASQRPALPPGPA